MKKELFRRQVLDLVNSMIIVGQCTGNSFPPSHLKGYVDLLWNEVFRGDKTRAVSWSERLVERNKAIVLMRLASNS